MKYDVAIIGGGPAGATCGSFLRLFRPGFKVGIFERETFPREHVGESQLPLCCKILDEIGAWDKIEQAGFPVKIGATYRWGNSDGLWDFNFLPSGDIQDIPRPAKFEGQRLLTAFQVDRSVFDKILLDHARELGCQVSEGTAVRQVLKKGHRVDGLVLEDGTVIEARYYVDASGHAGFLRRAMGVPVEEPSALKNIAIWDYWQNAEWAVKLGIGGTRIQIMSVGYGWLWFIPLSPTRTSLGFVCPADYYRDSGLRPEELYLKAISDEPRIRVLVKNGEREGPFQTTKDWSFLAERWCGENWFLIGEAGGFADPILSAGMSLAHASAREAAFSILEMGTGRDKWLREQYENRSKRKVLQHIKFADYWYSANAHFSELKEFTRQIAKDDGIDLDAEAAFQWLGTAGFVEEDMVVGGLALFDLASVHLISKRLSNVGAESPIDGYSGFVLNLKGAEEVQVASYWGGKVTPIAAYRRGQKLLPMVGMFGLLVAALRYSPSIDIAGKFIIGRLREQGRAYDATTHADMVQALEAMARDGWVKCKKFEGATPIACRWEEHHGSIGANHDQDLPADRLAAGLRE
jgi:flavin-dependent dehydrogenase